MAAYAYKASTREGRIVEGLMEASGEAAVVASLRGQGFIPLSVRQGGAASGSRGFALPDLASMSMPWQRGKKVKSRDLMIFTGELATLLKAGLPLDRSLASLSALAENPSLKAIISQVLSRVQEGRSLSQALGEHASVFPPLYVNMIRAGEAGGIMEEVLERLADYLERSEKTREQIKSAMVYPIILVVTAGGAIAILLTVVLPRFAAIFTDLGTAMPASTQTIMAISEYLRTYWWVVGLLVAATWYGVKRYLATPAGRERYDTYALRAPVIGDLVSKLQVARFARTLGTMLRGGVPLIQSLDIVRTIVPNVVITRALAAVQRDVSEGKGLSGPLEKTGVFPALALQMVSVGEETGRLDEMLIVVSDHYDREVTNAVARVMTLIGPVILIFMGVTIGVIVWAMMSAVFSVNQMIM